MKREQDITALAFLSPNIFGFLIFTLFPVLAALALSLFRWDIFHAPKFIGLQLLWCKRNRDHRVFRATDKTRTGVVETAFEESGDLVQCWTPYL